MNRIYRFGPAVVAILAVSILLPAGAGAAQAAHDRSWMLEHLGAAGLEKCQAFGKVRKDAEQLQTSRHGQLSNLERQRLEAELSAVKLRAPRSVTPSTCGAL